jgi:hypothetical protein
MSKYPNNRWNKKNYLEWLSKWTCNNNNYSIILLNLNCIRLVYNLHFRNRSEIDSCLLRLFFEFHAVVKLHNIFWIKLIQSINKTLLKTWLINSLRLRLLLEINRFYSPKRKLRTLYLFTIRTNLRQFDVLIFCKPLNSTLKWFCLHLLIKFSILGLSRVLINFEFMIKYVKFRDVNIPTRVKLIIEAT